LLYVKKTYQSENTNNKNCVKKYTFNQKGSEESSRNVCSADLEDSNGKEELYLRKITIFDVWDYYSTKYEIIVYSTLLDHKDKLYVNIYLFM
jgi:hypothetical protein